MYSESSSSLYTDSSQEIPVKKEPEIKPYQVPSDSASVKRDFKPLDAPNDLYPADKVWTPEKSFPGLFVAVDEKGSCVVSGPSKLLNEAKQQIRDIIRKHHNIEVTKDIRTIIFEDEN